MINDSKLTIERRRKINPGISFKAYNLKPELNFSER